MMGKSKMLLLHTGDVSHMTDSSENKKKKKNSKNEVIENLFFY